MNAAGRVSLAICACLIAGATVAGQAATESGGPPSQPAASSPATGAQPPATAAADTTVAPVQTGNAPSQVAPVATSSAAPDSKTVANKPGRKVLVDNTVDDAQLKQIRAKGYQPESQARGNEVYYCRSEHEVGSRFATKTCKTAQRILEEEVQGKEATATFQQRSEDRMHQ